MVKSFRKWCEDKRFDLDALINGKPSHKKPQIQEKASRAGFAHWAYPDAYIRQQYPDGWFMPRAADARFKMGNHQPNRKAAPDGTPG